MAGTFARQKNTEVIYICDVDEIALQKGSNPLKKLLERKPKESGF